MFCMLTLRFILMPTVPLVNAFPSTSENAIRALDQTESQVLTEV